MDLRGLSLNEVRFRVFYTAISGIKVWCSFKYFSSVYEELGGVKLMHNVLSVADSVSLKHQASSKID